LATAGLAVAIPNLVPVAAPLQSDLRCGLWLAALGCVAIPLTPFRYLAEADQRGYVVNVVLLGQALGMMALSLTLAWLGWGITGQFLAVTLGTLLASLLMGVLEVRRFPEVWSAARHGTRLSEARAQLRSLNGPSLVLGLTGRLSLFTDNMIVASLLSP